MSSRPLLVFLLLIATPLCAAPPDAVLRFAEELKNLQGRFEQQAFAAGGELREQASGRVALAAPGRFRWDYEDPYPQTIIADGVRIWVYDPELEQVSVRGQADEQGNPLAALTDPAELERQFELLDEGEQDGLVWVRLTPRRAEEAQIIEARLGFDGAALREMHLLDALQQRSVLRFVDWQRNIDLDPALFRFVIPEGVDVVGDPDGVGDPGQQAEVFAVPASD